MYHRSVLLRHIFNLTGNELDFINTKQCIHISEKYHLLLYDRLNKNNISLNDLADIYNDIVLRKEETGEQLLDKHGRFDHDKSFLVQNGLDQSPIIDELILDVIKQLNLKVKSIWPEGKKAAVCLTHDVDSIDGFSYFYLRKINWYWNWLRASIKGNYKEAYKWMTTLRSWIKFKKLNFDPSDSFEQIRKLEDNYGFRSTFFFMALRHGLSREGRRYSYNNPRFVHVAQELLEDGWEVGLHGAYYDHLSLLSLKEQKQRLEDIVHAKVYGCRHHYVRVRFPQSWMLYAQAGFEYSSNMGWGSGFQGFRAGTCLPYQPLREYSLWEIPFQLMDMNSIVDIENYINIFNQYLKLTKVVGGCLVINFHQEHFQEEVALGVGKLYRKILDTIAKDQDVAVLKMNEVYKTMNRLKIYYGSSS